MSDYDQMPPPSNVTVDHERRPVLYTADGNALVRTAGFTRTGEQAVQTTTVYPQTNTGKKGGKKKGC